MNEIIEAKELAKEVRKFIKQRFSIENLSVKTKGCKVFISWTDFNFNDFTTEVENFINEIGKSKYFNVDEIEFWREFSPEYMMNNQGWNKDKRLKTIKWKNELEKKENKVLMLADFAKVVYVDKTVSVEFSNSNESKVFTYDYKKSLSHKKYVDIAMDQLGIQTNSDFRYSWDMTAL